MYSLLASLAVMLALPQHAVAASACVGEISSQAIEPLPIGQPLDVDIFDDTNENLRFRTDFPAALGAGGYQTRDGGPLIVTFTIESEGGMFASIGGASFDPAVSSPSGGAARIMAGVARLPDRRTTVSGAGAQLQVVTNIRDTRTGRVIWVADLRCEMLTTDRPRIAASIIEPIIRTLGQTNTRAPFPLP